MARRTRSGGRPEESPSSRFEQLVELAPEEVVAADDVPRVVPGSIDDILTQIEVSGPLMNN